MTVLTNLPLRTLRASPLNVRKTGGADLEPLVASIRAHGVLQSLCVVDRGDHFEVVAGGRRLAALQQLAEQRFIDPEHAVPCQVVEELGALEASAAENLMREAMHPADEFDAFRAIADQGFTVAEIAARFGCTELLVRQRLKLANVSPRLLQLYREGKAQLGQMQALAIVDDHAAQEEAWDAATHDWQRQDYNLRERLTNAHVGAGDPRVRFVGLEAYRAAGGGVLEDLFGNRTVLTDAALLNDLVAERLQARVDEVLAAGWAWAEARASIDYSELASYKEAGRPDIRELTPKEFARVNAIEARLLELTRLEDEEGMSDEQMEEFDLLESERDRINEQRAEIYSAEVKAASGVIVTPDRVIYARLKPGEKAGKGGSVAVGGHLRAAPGKGEKQPGELSQAAVQRLEAEASLKIAVDVADHPRVALVLLASELARPVFYSGHESRFVHIGREHSNRMPGPVRQLVDESDAGRALERIEAEWKKRLPKAKGELIDWLYAQPEAVTHELLAFLVAREVESVKLFPGSDRDVRDLAAAARVDLSATWSPCEDWLATLPKPVVVELVREAAGKTAAASLEKLKKDQLPAAALALLPAGWLPKPLRPKAEGRAKKAKAARGKDAAAGEGSDE